MAEPFTVLTETEHLDELIEASMKAPVLLYKHSNICGVCLGTIAAFREAAGKHAGDDATFAFVEVRESRPVSNDAAERLGVPHQSPQAILIVGGEAVWNASHFSITADAIEEALAEQAG